jgi:catechol 2,3-dioxygenase-like lactoylglutathione lyase family enzyme
MSRARLVPELLVSEIGRSLDFYLGVCGWRILWERPEEGFAYLAREGAELMLEEPRGRVWVAGPLEHPFGRGVNLQIEVADVDALYAAVLAAGHVPFLALEEKWYRTGDVLGGNRQFIVSDPDGYLLRYFGDLGTRPV